MAWLQPVHQQNISTKTTKIIYYKKQNKVLANAELNFLVAPTVIDHLPPHSAIFKTNQL